MKQAARCPNCRTVFRVQPQQLQASGGWARCGQCGEVFNALQALVAVPQVPSATPGGGAAPAPAQGGRARTALDSNPPPVSSLYRRAEPTPAVSSPTPREAASPRTMPREPAAPAEPTAPATHAVAPPAAPAAMTPPQPPAPMPAAVPPSGPAAPLPDLNSMLPPEGASSRFMSPPAAPAEPAAPAAPAAATEAPSFLQTPAPPAPATEAQRTWWSAAATVLALTALLEMLLIARPVLSASFPGLRPVLQPLCALMRCNAEGAPRHLAALAVESSALSKLSGSEQRYRLSLVLRNRDSQALRWPAVELRLTDAQGVLLVRRVLRPRELGVPTPAIAAGQELPLQVLLDMGEQPVAGYSVELFYP